VFCNFDFFEIEPEVIGYSVKFPEDLILCDDVLHVLAEPVVLLRELVELVVGDA
jgi:hypothetical protein